ncbi:unknown [Prevotella sp. CAG:1092]|nr:unknown [Prevotella sp. CAG:1092]
MHKGDNKGFTFRAAAYDEGITCNVQSEGCTIYGVQKAELSYRENVTDRWKWPGCIHEEIASTYKFAETADEDCLKKMDANIKTWIINTSSYNPRNEFDKLLKLVKPKENI